MTRDPGVPQRLEVGPAPGRDRFPLPFRSMASASGSDEVAATASTQDVIPLVSPNDKMFSAEYPESYFVVGVSALHTIRNAQTLIGAPPPARILDMPCGHGRVLRTLKAAYPTSDLTACDIDRDGVDFAQAPSERPPSTRRPTPPRCVSGSHLT